MPSADAVPGGAPNSEALYLFGPVLPVLIGSNQDPRMQDASSIVAVHRYALVDTGATDSCIDSNLAHALGLRVVDERNVATPGGIETFNVYSGWIEVPELNFAKRGPLMGANLSAGGQPYGALLGRDFLRHCSMHYDGETGSVTISNPSQGLGAP